MFKKVIVAEDFDSNNLGLQKTLEELKISDVTFTSYCDDAFQWMKRSIADKNPFDLLITDLSFDVDYRKQVLSSGKDLILAAQEILPNLKTIVFSIEKKPQIIKNLFEEYGINGFVSKGRGDAYELKKAIKAVFNHEEYLSLEHKQSLKQNNSVELSQVEYTILSLLSQGVLQKNIPFFLQEKNIKPHSLSSVEKTLNALKTSLNAANNEQLIARCKDVGIL